MVPLGTKVTIFIPKKDRKVWDYHAVQGFYLGAAMHHYRCHRIYIPKTRTERVSETVEFHPKYYKMPYESSMKEAIELLKKLVTSLKHIKPESPFSLKNN